MRGWRRALRVAAWGAVVLVVGAIALTFASAFVVGGLCGDAGGGVCDDAEGVVYAMGMLVGLPAFLLAIPALLVAAAVEYSLNPAERGTPIVAAWDVSVDGESHLVSLPESRAGPGHAWVDGQRVPLRWTGALGTGRAALDGGSFSGTISGETDAGEGALLVLATAVLASGGDTPTIRYALEVEGAKVEAVPVAGGERQT